ncbi:MAG: tetratricopeptide repeat protein [Phycisphaerae bacterium]
MAGEPPSGNADADRASRIDHVLEGVIAERLSGSKLTDDEVISAHEDLMPELGQELAALSAVERARARAADAVTVDSAGSTSGVEAGPLSAGATDSFPNYTVTHEIHRGGQGVVYQAIHNVTKRKVAIKVMREGPFAGPHDRARFDREVQILAKLNHPHIVAIHDSGVAAGCHYFVMDYISGEPLDAFLADRTRPINDVLRIFTKICDAVNAAHLRGVIHRDLKPSNIRLDENGEPQILDFGLAKMATGNLIEGSQPAAISITGQFIGSLPWASPEQAEGVPEKIDVRTDVYSLGVVLYQALTGRFPYDVVGNMRDVLENILKREPAKPSTVRRQINDEIETIVLKCLSKERGRRYQSAGELGRDIDRYLSGEPIEAKRASGWYVFKKMARRYRVSMAVIVTFVVLITAAAVSLSIMYRRQGRLLAAVGAAKDAADAARADAEVAQAEAEGEAEVKRIEALKAKRVVKLLTDMLTFVDPDRAQGRDVTVREVLDVAATEAETGLADEPEVLAYVLDTIGVMYLRLGLHQPSETALRSALETRRARVPADPVDVAESLNNLGALLYANGHYAEAEGVLRAALDSRTRLLGVDDVDTAETQVSLGATLYARGKYAEAATLASAALATQRKHLGAQDVGTTEALGVLGAIAKRNRDQLDQAQAYFRQEADIRIARFGRRHTTVATALNNLASVLADKGDVAEAERVYREVLEIKRDLYGDDHPKVAVTLSNLVGLLRDKGDLDGAEPYARQVLAIRRRTLGSSHPDLALALRKYGLLQRDRGALDDAERAFTEALAIERQRSSVAGKKGVASTLVLLGTVLIKKGDAAGAVPMLRECLTIRRDVLEAGDWKIASTESALGEALVMLGRFDEAEPLLIESYPIIREARGDRPPTPDALKRIVRLYDAWGKPDKAAEYRALLEALTAPAAKPED